MGAEAIREPFGVINADDFYGMTSFQLLARQLESGTRDYAMVGFVLRNTLSEFGSVARGLCRVGPDGLLQTVTELTKIEPDGSAARHTDAAGLVHPLTGDEIVSMNMWGFTPSIFEHLRDEKTEFFIPSVVNQLINRGQERLKVLRTPDSWFGITYREDRPRVTESVRRLIEQGHYPAKLWP
jgi:hypothetical protein